MGSNERGLGNITPRQGQKQSATTNFCGLEHFSCCLSFFDSSKGQREGKEHEKVLAFFPQSNVPKDTQTSMVGLAQALHGFSNTFKQEQNDSTQSSGSFITLEAAQNLWFLHHCEPCIWLMLVASKSWLGQHPSHDSFKAYLTNLHHTAVLLHGPLQQLINQDLQSAHTSLQPILDEAGRLLVGPGPRIRLSTTPTPLTREACALVNPLGLNTGIPLLVTPLPSFLSVQCLSGQLMNVTTSTKRSNAHPGTLIAAPDFEPLHPVQGVQVSWHGHPIWSNLGPSDSTALHSLAQKALLPAAGTDRKKASTLKAAIAAAAATATAMLPGTATSIVGAAATPASEADTSNQTLISSSQWGIVQPGTVEPVLATASSSLPTPFSNQAVSSTTSTTSTGMFGMPAQQQQASTIDTVLNRLGATGTMTATLNTNPQPQATTATGWICHSVDSKEDSHQASTLGYVTTTRVWSQTYQKHMQLLVYYHGAVLVCMLLDAWCDSKHPDFPQVLSAITKVLDDHIPGLANQLADSLPIPSTLWHQQGFRYSHEDLLSSCTRATPVKKMASVTDATLRLAGHARNKLGCWLQAGDGFPSSDEPENQDLALELIARTASDGFVVLRHTGCHALHIANDQIPNQTLPGASAHAQKLCDALFPGVYAGFL